MTEKCYFGDAASVLANLHGQGLRAQCCVTSPPYYGLRSYLPNEAPSKALEIGLEPSPEAYIARLMDVFRGVRDCMADDGTLWLNIGDSYTSGGRAWRASDKKNDGRAMETRPATPDGLKHKDLIGIPWMLAFALRADGWYLRQDIIWHKPNPMPESVTDRCTKAHEYLFLLSKSERYYFDHAAMQEPATQAGRVRADKLGGGKGDVTHHSPGSVFTGSESRNRRSVWTIQTRPFSGAHFAVFPPALITPCILAGSRPGDVVLDPFFGSGTTGQVAEQFGRRWIGIDLNDAYLPMQAERTAQTGMML